MAGEAPAPAILAFWSPSGSGATTLAAAAAVHLATGGAPSALGGDGTGAAPPQSAARGAGQRGRPAPPLRVRAADLDRIAPSLGQHLGLFPPRRPEDHCLSRLFPALAGGRLGAGVLGRALLPVPACPHLAALPGCYSPWAAQRLDLDSARRLVQALAAGCDVLVLDAGPALDCPLAFAALAEAQTVVLVTGPTAPERLHARRYLLALHELGWGRKALVALNRCSAPGEGWAGRVARAVAAALAPGPGQVAAELGHPVVAAVPLLPHLAAHLEQGQIPYLAARGAAAQAFRAAVAALCQRALAQARGEPAGRLPAGGEPQPAAAP